jgi:TonB family protein
MNLLSFVQQDPVRKRPFLPIARRSFTAAVFSCIVHILALGFSATIMLSQRSPVIAPLQVTLFQSAVPLPVRENRTPGPQDAIAGSVPVSKVPLPLEPLRKPPLHSSTHPVVEAIRTPALPPPLLRHRAPLPLPKISAPIPEEPSLPTGLLPSLVGADATSALARFGRRETDAAEGKRKGRNKGGSSGAGGRTTLSARPDYGVNPKPPYPMLARRRGDQGVVLLRVHVRADGSVVTAEIKQSSGSSLLDDTALQTVRESWRFIPARLHSAPVESWVEVPIRFVLGDG